MYTPRFLPSNGNLGFKPCKKLLVFLCLGSNGFLSNSSSPNNFPMLGLKSTAKALVGMALLSDVREIFHTRRWCFEGGVVVNYVTSCAGF
jgi:hypothetical protein